MYLPKIADLDSFLFTKEMSGNFRGFYSKVQKLPQNLVCGEKISVKVDELALKNLENYLIYKAKISLQSFYTWPNFKLQTFQGNQRWLSRKCWENLMFWVVMTLLRSNVFIQHQLSSHHEVQQQYSSLFTLAGRKNSLLTQGVAVASHDKVGVVGKWKRKGEHREAGEHTEWGREDKTLMKKTQNHWRISFSRHVDNFFSLHN